MYYYIGVFNIYTIIFINRKIGLEEGHSIPYMKCATLTVYDIPSMEHPGSSVGSVSFADTFMESTITTVLPGTSDVQLETTVKR